MKKLNLRFKDVELLELIKKNANYKGVSTNQFIIELLKNNLTPQENFDLKIIPDKPVKGSKLIRLSANVIDGIKKSAIENGRTFSKEIELRLLTTLDNQFRLLTAEEQEIFKKLFFENHNCFLNLYRLQKYIISVGEIELTPLMRLINEVRKETQKTYNLITEIRKNNNLNFYYSKNSKKKND